MGTAVGLAYTTYEDGAGYFNVVAGRIIEAMLDDIGIDTGSKGIIWENMDLITLLPGVSSVSCAAGLLLVGLSVFLAEFNRHL